jgi:LytS/YehU family sensor histidine kinase
LENEALKRANITAQFEVLKQQVNPHFLFNSLNILKTMVKAKEEQAEEYILRLSDVYRYLLQSNLKDKVQVSEELLLLQSYSYMLKVRFEENISFEINLSKEALNSWMPPLTFQLLVENCVKHNIISHNKPLKIELFDEGDRIILRNNLQLKRSIEASTHIGLENLKQRYAIMTDTRIEISKNEPYFSVALPIMAMNTER